MLDQNELFYLKKGKVFLDKESDMYLSGESLLAEIQQYFTDSSRKEQRDLCRAGGKYFFDLFEESGDPEDESLSHDFLTAASILTEFDDED